MKIIDCSKLKTVIRGMYHIIPQTGICRLYGSLFLYMLLDEDDMTYIVKKATKKEIKQAKAAKTKRKFNDFFIRHIILRLS